MNSQSKYVYSFQQGSAEGAASMKDILGGKGANLAEMASLNLPVPPGFTISAKACHDYLTLGRHKLFAVIKEEVEDHLKSLERVTGKTFGSDSNPLLVSVRSGAAISMPGMMDTVLNLGLNTTTLQSMIKLTGNERLALDSYRRFIQMFGDIVLGIQMSKFEKLLSEIKIGFEVTHDFDLPCDALRALIDNYKQLVLTETGESFPEDPEEQLWDGIDAVFNSWNNPRAQKYRKIHGIKGLQGTAVTVQTMVFGNEGSTSATGVAFTRNPCTGSPDYLYGEFLLNAQGEDVVAGIRTPHQITISGSREWAQHQNISEAERITKFPSMQELLPDCFNRLEAIRSKLETHYRDMQDVEFTIERGQLFMLQTRTGKRSTRAAVQIATDLVKEELITEKEAVMRIDPAQLDQLLHPIFIEDEINLARDTKLLGKGLPASPGAASGHIVFSADKAEQWAAESKSVILCRHETSPEDIGGMHVSNGILTERGGMTSHAAVVARGMGTCCVAGCSDIHIDYAKSLLIAGEQILNEGDYISLNGSTGEVFKGEVTTELPSLEGAFTTIMELSDKYKRLQVFTNADTPEDTEAAIKFGAEGTGLCRTEHMFFGDDRIIPLRELILVAEDVKTIKRKYSITNVLEMIPKTTTEEQQKLHQYKEALLKLKPFQQHDFTNIFKSLNGRACTIRLLDPPLHEFLPKDEAGLNEMATQLDMTQEKVHGIVEKLQEFNPMLGHRGCRLGITYPEITIMQVQAICEAAASVENAHPEIMIPLIGNINELSNQKRLIEKTIESESTRLSRAFSIPIGTMIEIPRACVTADEIAHNADFFSFGTNDLTQMSCGFSRDDAGTFLCEYLDKEIINDDPFQVLDQNGVGELMKVAVTKGRSIVPNLKIGICGEHGGEPKSIDFCHKLGLNYVSCSPFRVPIARLAAAQAAIRNEE